jgi:amino acid transporter
MPANEARQRGGIDGTRRGALGTFSGVFTPSVLTILGIILFLRLGFVTGAAGILRALLIILLANAISVLTSISLSAIATNLRVKGGGDYYLISRTLGVEYGGALGIVLFLAQSVSIAFYAIGFGEAVTAILGVDLPWPAQAIAAVAVSLLLILAWMGADWATRFQFVVMGVLFLAITAFFLGGLPDFNMEQLRSNLLPPDTHGGSAIPFWVVFALFFPAVTGFTQGVSMSGDLRNPGKSLPLGTFLAVGVSLVVYIGVALVFAGTVPAAELIADYNVMRSVSLVPWLVDAGVIAATLSSALASFLGAPRILQSLAADRIFPLGFFATVHGPDRNPRRGVLLSAGIAYGTIALGDLNVIAPVVSMFFLISYGLLNYATYIEARANSPSFRPRFHWFNARLSLAGAIGCMGVMLAIHPAAAIVSVVLLFGIYQYVAGTAAVDRWADSSQSRRFQRMRDDLYATATEPEHPRYWRPILLAFSDSKERRGRLLRFASWLEGESGLTTVVRVIQGSGPRLRRVRKEAEDALRSEVERLGLHVFPRAIVAPDVDHAVPLLLQAYGLGPVRVNTVLLNWPDWSKGDTDQRSDNFVRRLRVTLRFTCNLVILSAGARDFEAIERTRPGKRSIDVWHRDNATGRLMLLLAYLMTRTETWQDARIRLLTTVPKDKSESEATGELERMLDDVRIAAEPVIVGKAEPRTVIEQSCGSSAVFLPFSVADQEPTSVYGSPRELLPQLGMAALVLGAQDIELDADPEGGEHGEIAQAVDAAEKTSKTVRKIEEDAARTAAEAQEKREELEAAAEKGATSEELADLESATREADQEAERSKRRAAKARAKAEIAAEEADTLTGKQTAEDSEDPASGRE